MAKFIDEREDEEVEGEEYTSLEADESHYFELAQNQSL